MNEENKPLTFVMDIDGTICPIKSKDEQYSDLVPYPEMVRKMKEYHLAGAKIVLYTSRNMNSYHGNIGEINVHTAPILLEWLEKWEIPYDEIVFGKVWPGHNGYYIDDRTIRPKEFLTMTPDQMNQVCSENRV